MLLFPLPLAEKRKMETKKVESWLCTMHYAAGCEEQIAVDKAIF